MAAQPPRPIQTDILDYYNMLRQRMNALPELGADDALEMEALEPREDVDYRSKARRVALQALYEMDAAQHPLALVLDTHLAAHPSDSKSTRQYAQRLVRRVNELMPALDAVIVQFAPAYPIGQIALIDRNVLRIALYELLFIPSQPISAIIDEAVELAIHFGAENSGSFVNGVLGSVVDDPDRLHAMRQRLRSTQQEDDAQEKSDL